MASKLLLGLVFVALVYFGSVYGADCYGEAKAPELSASQHYQVRDAFCGEDFSSRGKTYHFGWAGNRRKDIWVGFSGNTKAKYCRAGVTNIIDQCLGQTCGRNACPKNGGRWDWSSGAEEAHFEIRGGVAWINRLK